MSAVSSVSLLNLPVLTITIQPPPRSVVRVLNQSRLRRQEEVLERLKRWLKKKEGR